MAMTDRKMSRREVIGSGAAAAGVLTAAQLFGSINVARAQSAKRYKIAIVPKGLNNPVFKSADFGGQTRAAELGNVDFKFIGPAQSDASQQVATVDGLISAGYDGIGISCDSAETLLEPINRAVAKGIKVITWDSDSPKSNRSVFYGVDSFKGGQLQAKLLNDLLKGKKGDIWLLSGAASAQNLEARIHGVQSVLSKDLTVAGTSFCNDDVALAVSETENVLRAHPALIGYIMIGGWPLFSSSGALPTLKARAKAGLQVVAFDYLEQELPFIVDGTVKASVGQDYWGWGYQSVTILAGLIGGKHYPAFVPQALPVVTSANAADYQKKWDDSKTAGGMAEAFKEPPVSPS
jgi:ribose transport system substrate-binding protein